MKFPQHGQIVDIQLAGGGWLRAKYDAERHEFVTISPPHRRIPAEKIIRWEPVSKDESDDRDEVAEPDEGPSP